MTPEMRSLLAQIHEEWMHDPSLRPNKHETMRWAYQQICAGKDPWTGLGSFKHTWYGYAKNIRADLVREPLELPEQETKYTRQWAAFCAASVEFLCERYNVACPEWVYDPHYTLEIPWWHSQRADDPTIQEDLLKTTPAPFARRNVFCGNRLFQNKYEMYEWTQEARSKGLKDPGAIWRYARDKEIAIHGA